MIPAVTFKASVRLDPPTPALARLLAACDQLARMLGVNVLVSCGREDHPPVDPHTQGRALDLSVANFTNDQTLQALKFLSSVLGDSFYVQYEVPATPVNGALKNVAIVNSGATAPHLHVQVRKGVAWPDVPPMIQPGKMYAD